MTHAGGRPTDYTPEFIKKMSMYDAQLLGIINAFYVVSASNDDKY